MNLSNPRFLGSHSYLVLVRSVVVPRGCSEEQTVVKKRMGLRYKDIVDSV